MSWSSWHVHVNSPAALDDVLLDVVVPVLDDRPWFFVRHWQGGPHLRLRVRSSDDIGPLLSARLSEVDAGVPVTAEAHRASVVRVAELGEGAGPLPVEPLRPPGVYRETYRPEGLSEELFHHSSKLAAGLVLAMRANPLLDRLSLGSRVLLAGLGVIEGDPRKFALRSLEHWVSYVGAVDVRPGAEQSGALRRQMHMPTGPFAGLAHALHGQGDHVIGAHLHLTCNRLGLGLGGEARLWALIAAVLDSAACREPLMEEVNQ